MAVRRPRPDLDAAAVPAETHYPGPGSPEPYVRICPFCKRDLTGYCLVIKTPQGQPVLVAEPAKCPRCGRALLFGEKESPIIKPPGV